MSRGEEDFAHFPGIAARLYDSLARTKPLQTQYEEIAQDLVSRVTHGRLLDIGTGTGRLLMEIHALNPDIELFGLDISHFMIQQARKNVTGIKASLCQGTIQHTPYKDDFFDIVTCSGSFYLWDHPEECLEEIYRILKEGESAYLFETHKNFDANEFRKALETNLEKENIFFRLLSPIFLKKQVKMTYRIREFEEIITRTRFVESYTIEKIRLGGLPIWLRITLTKTLNP